MYSTIHFKLWTGDVHMEVHGCLAYTLKRMIKAASVGIAGTGECHAGAHLETRYNSLTRREQLWTA